ncbi:MAG: hypothetical protein WD533_05910 [Dehalococcoidia bacterium]
MPDLETRVQQMLNAPAGCAFLFIMAENGFTPAQAAKPDLAVYIGARAMEMVGVWQGDHQEIIAEIIRRGQTHAGLARELLAYPNAAWWFAPLDHANQVWLALYEEEALKEHIDEPGAPDSWDCYPQSPRDAFRTTTLFGDTAPFLAICEAGVCDYNSVKFPLAWWRLRVPAAARIYEVDGPEAWHALCTRYPWKCEPAEPFNQKGLLVPHWQAVAADWDAVHLTFGGALTAEQVRVESAAGWSRNWGWHAEQTLWLRWMFEHVERLPDRERQRQPYVDMRPPRLQAGQGAMLMRVDDPAAAEAERQRFVQGLLERRRRESGQSE